MSFFFMLRLVCLEVKGRTQPNQTAKALLLVLEGRCTRPISRLSLSSARSAASSNLGGVSRGFAVARSAVGVCQLAGDTGVRSRLIVLKKERHG